MQVRKRARERAAMHGKKVCAYASSKEFEHALPLSVARHGNWETAEVRDAMTALTVTVSSETRPLTLCDTSVLPPG